MKEICGQGRFFFSFKKLDITASFQTTESDPVKSSENTGKYFRGEYMGSRWQIAGLTLSSLGAPEKNGTQNRNN